MLTKVKAFFSTLWSRILLVDWSGLILAVLKAVKKEDQKIDPKYIAIKPRVLSDHNMLRGVSALRAVLAFIPPAAIAAPALGLGEMGFKIWKRIALAGEYDSILFPPVDPNVMRMQVQLDEELNKHYGQLVLSHNWDADAIEEVEKVYNDFSFITSQELLQAKYPHVDLEYIKSCCSRNRKLLDENLYEIEQEIIRASHKPEVDTNLRDALEALKKLFPAMLDWALFNSEGFDDVLEILDTVF